MSELDQILETITDWSERGVRFALATVVGVRGSTYRGLAARQLIAVDGTSVGTVSGGCLDADLHRFAERVIVGGRPELVEFDLTADDEAVWGWGIGCNGATELLVEPAPSALDLRRRMGEIRGEQRPTALVHSLSGTDLGRRSLVTAHRVRGSLPGEMVVEARRALEEGRHRVTTVDGQRVLIEVVGAQPRLIVCGGGHDAAPMVQLAHSLGFETVVVDERRQVLTRERFPDASALVHARAADLASAVELDHRSHVVLMSHNYLRDLDYLRTLVSSEVAYVGVLGPGARLERLLADLEKEGTGFDSGVMARLFGPAGLDIGAEGPLEIAWSILSEVLAVRSSRAGGSLRSRKGPEVLRRLGWVVAQRSPM